MVPSLIYSSSTFYTVLGKPINQASQIADPFENTKCLTTGALTEKYTQASPVDRERWSKLLCQTISSLCRNGMMGNDVMKIQGLIGITLCNKEVFLVDIADHFEVEDMDLVDDSQNGSKKSPSKSISRKRKASNPKLMKSPEDYYLDNESRENNEYGYPSTESQENHKRPYPEMWDNTNPNELPLPQTQPQEITDPNSHSYGNQTSYDYHTEFMQIKSENLDSVDQSVLDDAILKETTLSTTPSRKMRAKKEFSQTVATTKHTAELLGYQDFTPASSRPYTCRLCDASFSKRFCLANHIVTVHQVGGKYVCKQCGRQFLQRNRYMLHIEKHSTDGTKLVCPDCGKVFTVRGNYENHLKKCGAALVSVGAAASNNNNNMPNDNSVVLANFISSNNNNNKLSNSSGSNINEISADLTPSYMNSTGHFNANMSNTNSMMYHHQYHHHLQHNNNNNNMNNNNKNIITTNIENEDDDDDDDDNNNASNDNDDQNNDNGPGGGADDDVIKENVLLYDSDLEA
ncbi:hypothetical protein HELRODRAFT_170381 [Helobdella robusta]|uniref:C2H2-type domain-containing protein n=1 Tax=Helobdella robusta TaxID=6412 RepID=T1F2Z2_HELRO|nr:hypothetical protein HELRODRAFT_170381 [Helobdella robusta]ESO07822.1 hypothetical protein HELRODRAFT_170381 [Helobdella robusta]